MQSWLTLLLAVLLASPSLTQHAQPNVLLIICDDLNDWIGPLGGHPQAHTPNLDAFAETAVSFTHAYTNTPVCAPSRASFLTGILPHTSGNLFWDEWHENDILAHSKTIMTHFRDHGYTVVGAGKLMHHQRPEEWDELAFKADYGPLAYDGKNKTAHPAVRRPFFDIGPIDGSFGRLDEVPYADADTPNAGWVRGGWTRDEPKPFRFNTPDDRAETPDERTASWAIERLDRFATKAPDTPFFLAVGLIRPHTPMHAPGKYFDLFPLDSVRLPSIKLDDERDTHYHDHFAPEVKGLRYHTAIAESYASREEGLRRFTQAYLACVAFADDQIGRVLNALEDSPFAENTIVVITSDHGFNVGEKAFLFKNSPWEESCRIPLLIRAPGVSTPAATPTHPVSLIDIYPTLNDLCNIQADTRKDNRGRPLDGYSLRPFLVNANTNDWSGPEAALTLLHAGEESSRLFPPEYHVDPTKQHWSLRTARYRYIRYNTGATELYDHTTDPNEWQNLAGDPRHSDTLTRLGGLLDQTLETTVNHGE